MANTKFMASQGGMDAQKLECINPRLQKYRLRWNFKQQETEDGKTIASFTEYEFLHKPTIDECKSIIKEWIDTLGSQAVKVDGKSYVLDKQKRATIKDYLSTRSCGIALLSEDSSLSTFDKGAAIALLDAIDEQEVKLDVWRNNLKSSIEAESEIEQISGKTFDGEPETPEKTSTELASSYKEQKGSDMNSASVKLAKKLINTMELSEEEAVEMKALYPVWGPDDDDDDTNNVPYGTPVGVGFRCRVVERDENGKITSDVLWECVQAHTTQENWKPSIDTASIWKVVQAEAGTEHAGTLEDPIPYQPPMDLYNGKYYTQDGVKYYCNRDSGIPLSHDLSSLVGVYVQVVD